MIPTLNTGFWWLDAYVYLCLSMFALMVYRRWLNGQLKLVGKILCAPILIIFAIVDVSVNHALLWILGPKPYKTWTISQRFEYYNSVTYPVGFNKALAYMTCSIINQFDDLHC